MVKTSRRVKFVELVLTALQFQAEGLLTMAEILFEGPAESRRRFHGYKRPTQWFRTNWADAYRDRQQVHTVLGRLKRAGLIVNKGTRRNAHWVLTRRGIERAEAYRKQREDLFSAATAQFVRPQGEGVTIVSYDIPEAERRKRDWIRTCLVVMDFNKLQKSVWVSAGKIDKEFIKALRERNLMEHVHVFSVAGRGTIEKCFGKSDLEKLV